jgi:DNA mismatch repair protein MutL
MIQVLDKNVSELIAAGEVIERPASVVKELIENSIDAGAKSITVEIKNGGITFIRISDDGTGIPFEQCPTAFLRHATSKVRAGEDLNAIATLGFRGEALASVSAVSKVRLLTKTRCSDLGTSYKIEGGIEVEHEQAGCPDGTTIIIRDLFFNTPARLKFLKKDVSEGNSVQSAVDKAALVNPHITFRFVRDNKLVRVTAGDSQMYSAIYAVYGKSFAVSMIPVDCSQNGVCVNGFVSSPLFAKSNRAFQNFYVNSRYVRSATCAAALEEGYRNSIMTGKFPACVLNIRLNPADIDVNVHPAKTEVRFVNDRVIFTAVCVAVKNALLNNDTPVKTQVPQESEIIVFDSAKTEYSIVKPPAQLKPAEVQYKYINPQSFVKKEKPPVNQEVLVECEGERFRVVGELFRTYIVCERGENFVLIDKHAADERLRFDRLKNTLRLHSQLLIEPVKIQLDVELSGILADNPDMLSQIGLKVEVADCVTVIAMPSIIDNSKAEELVSLVAETLIKGGSLDGLYMFDTFMHSIACRAAVKAGDQSVTGDIKRLAEQVFDNPDLRYCPHGRPILITITKRELEKKFKRVL